ncbi:MAG: hypothetical protein IT199_06415 [Solirubrobacterales bacterium]|nr:hypothetical protein [Solirubrobacterales bacterium]
MAPAGSPAPAASADESSAREKTPGSPVPVAPGEGKDPAAIKVPPAPAPAKPEPTDPLDILDQQITEKETVAKTALEAAQAALKTDARTELTAITREVEGGRKELDESLGKAAAAIAAAEEKASQAEARLLRETSAGREAAAEWVRGQAAEIEADAALAAEMNEGGSPAAQADGPDPVLNARVAALEAELASEKASKEEALTRAAARLKEIEQSAKLAEARVEAAEVAATDAQRQAQANVAKAAGSANKATEAEAREAAVQWLRGQIAALRQEIAKGGDESKDGGTT